MSGRMSRRKQSSQTKDMGTTVGDLAKRPDGTWGATQGALDVVGTGDSAARATEDMARQIAEREAAGEL